MNVAIVALYGSISALLNILLALNVSRARRTHRVSLGTGDSPEVLRAVRAHGNNAEFVPLAIVMLLICELEHGSSALLHVAGGTLVVARLLQAYGILNNHFRLRVAGTATTSTLIIALSAYALVLR